MACIVNTFDWCFSDFTNPISVNNLYFASENKTTDIANIDAKSIWKENEWKKKFHIEIRRR